MNIVTGSGAKRTVFEFPHADIVNKSPVEQQVQARKLLCGMLKINPETEVAA